jgi:hypothetical protein
MYGKTHMMLRSDGKMIAKAGFFHTLVEVNRPVSEFPFSL